MSTVSGVDRSQAELRIVRITGSLVEARPASGAFLYELALVGERGMMGEVIRIDEDTATVEVYEDTTGLTVGEGVSLTGRTLTAIWARGCWDRCLTGPAGLSNALRQ